MQFFNRFIANESGATSIEYVVIAASLGIVIAGVVQAIGLNLAPIFAKIATYLH